jgi:phosphomethylpyrimidine synthase
MNAKENIVSAQANLGAAEVKRSGRSQEFAAASAHVDAAAVQPLPQSRKVYVTGSRPDIRVPMREISQSDTPAAMGAEKNPPICVYDCSGPYTDPSGEDRHPQGPAGAAPAVDRGARRQRELSGPSSAYGRERLADPALAGMRFDLKRKPRRAKAGMNVSQMHYARRGIVTPEMEFIAIRENQRAEASPNCCCASIRANPSARHPAR